MPISNRVRKIRGLALAAGYRDRGQRLVPTDDRPTVYEAVPVLPAYVGPFPASVGENPVEHLQRIGRHLAVGVQLVGVFGDLGRVEMVQRDVAPSFLRKFFLGDDNRFGPLAFLADFLGDRVELRS